MRIAPWLIGVVAIGGLLGRPLTAYVTWRRYLPSALRKGALLVTRDTTIHLRAGSTGVVPTLQPTHDVQAVVASASGAWGPDLVPYLVDRSSDSMAQLASGTWEYSERRRGRMSECFSAGQVYVVLSAQGGRVSVSGNDGTLEVSLRDTDCRADAVRFADLRRQDTLRSALTALVASQARYYRDNGVFAESLPALSLPGSASTVRLELVVARFDGFVAEASAPSTALRCRAGGGNVSLEAYGLQPFIVACDSLRIAE